jgi:AcrR family transcriptional regulator
MPTDAEPRKTPGQRRSVETVARILDAAARIFDERGYHRTTTNHIAEAAGVSIGSLYQYFPNKDALLVALAERHLDEATVAFEEQAAVLRATDPSVADVVRALVAFALDANDTQRLHAVLYADAPRTEALETRFRRFVDLVAAEVAHHLRRTSTGGEVADRRARLLVVAVDAAVHRVVLDAPPGAARQAALNDLVDLIRFGIDRSK